MELNLDSGIQKVTINCVGSVEVYFNPTDVGFMEKLYTAMEKLEKKQKEAGSWNTEKQMFYGARKLNAEMHKVIDEVFNKEVAGVLFGGVDCFALADGAPLWFNLLMAIIEQMDDSIKKEMDKTESRLAKYTAKYKKK